MALTIKNAHSSKGRRRSTFIILKKITDYHAEGSTIVYLDERGFVHDMPRSYGDAPMLFIKRYRLKKLLKKAGHTAQSNHRIALFDVVDDSHQQNKLRH